EETDVLELQIVPYACARRFAPDLINIGQAEFMRLNRFWISPVRSWGRAEQFPLPGCCVRFTGRATGIPKLASCSRI
ncbi:MAG: hypothetical protein P4N59_11075, partial [Negativicutes bacterium]|nr:hypothetical protein [Negativicutes bacterium]